MKREIISSQDEIPRKKTKVDEKRVPFISTFIGNDLKTIHSFHTQR